MPLTAGTRIGPYEVVSLLGVGGMGEVYRARDARLGRDVALKVLPDLFAEDAERLARFRREAQVLATLNHPHIAAIYGLEESPAEVGASRPMRALVLELVEGETLAEHIARRAGPSGPSGLPLDEALPIARQIADALEAAHEQGVIHRDLKPANIKITPDGVVKVLDFGLAKLAGPPEGGHYVQNGRSVRLQPDLSQSPTITTPAMMTGVGTILGTAAYMAPEQAKGRPADKRSDVWAFGCVLFEMLTAKRAFEGEDVSDTLAAVLRGEPDWIALPTSMPASITALLRACLTRDRRKRPGDVAAIAFVLDHGSELVRQPPVAGVVPHITQSRSRLLMYSATAAILAIGVTLVGIRLWMPSPTPLPVTRFEIQPPPGDVFPGANSIPRFAVSPDGRSVAFEAGPQGRGPFRLWIRRLASIEAQPLGPPATTSDVAIQSMFWFPDGRTLGFFDEINHKLKQIDVQSGVVQSLVDVQGNQFGGSVNGDGTILFSSVATKGLLRVSSNGGIPAQVTTLDSARHETMHLWPRFLPDGRHFLYHVQTQERGDWGVYAGSLDSPDRTLVVRSEAMAEFAPPDRLLYVRGDSLVADTMDMNTFQPAGQPVLVAQPVFATPQGRVGFSVSNTGVLVHATGGVLTSGGGLARVLTWIDRDGREEPVGAPVRSYTYPRISPDGTRLALDIRDQENDIWVWDFLRKTLSRLTFGPSFDRSPVWTPDGKRIIFASGTPLNLFSTAADGTGTPERLGESTNDQLPSAVSPNGAQIVFNENTGAASQDLRTLALDAGHRVKTLLQIPSAQRNGTISPDGRWMAYESFESGQAEIFVRPYPDIEKGRWQVSTNTGRQPVWARDGRELFYVSLDTLMAVRVESAQAWTASTPRALFPLPSFNTVRATGVTYDISPDGRRFLVLKPTANEQAASAHPVVIQNWLEELKRLAPAN